MMDKQKQIEEIKRIIDDRCEAKLGQVHTNNGNVTKTVDTSLIAKDIYNAGYRKIPEGGVIEKDKAFAYMQGKPPENAVVLTIPEKERLLRSALEFDQTIMECLAKEVRKETAEKFAERVKMAFYYEFDELIPSIMADKIDEICNEITEGKV